MFGISGFELLIIVAFVLIIFGPDKLPELARTAGKAMRMFKKAQQEMEHMLHLEMLSETADNLVKTQKDALSGMSAPGDATVAPTASDAAESAAAAWSVTSEDDEEEEEDEE